MPTYDYVCAACGAALEIYQSMSEPPKKKCPACGKSRLERKIGAGAGFLFKGGGFYQTDYRSSSYKSGEKADSGSSGAPKAPEGAGAPGSTDASAKSEPAKPDAPKPDAGKSQASKSDGKRSDAKHSPKKKTD